MRSAWKPSVSPSQGTLFSKNGRMDTFLLQAQNLVKRYKGVTAVDNISLHVRKGECFALLGPNGAGKTTSCEILEGLLSADEGQLSICGMNYASSRKEILSLIGVQLQETHLYKKYTVLETLQLFASFYRQTESLEKILSLLGLTELRHRRLEGLSGGQRQSVYLACALVHKPLLLFLDEPTAGLDPRARHKIWDLIHSVKSEDRGIFLTTHYLEEAERLADRIAIMDRGRIVAEGCASELVNRFCPGELLKFSIEGSEHDALERGQFLTREFSWLSNAERDRNSFKVHSPNASRDIQDLTLFAGKNGIALNSFSIRPASLEDVFLKVTGRVLDESV